MANCGGKTYGTLWVTRILGSLSLLLLGGYVWLLRERRLHQANQTVSTFSPSTLCLLTWKGFNWRCYVEHPHKEARINLAVKSLHVLTWAQNANDGFGWEFGLEVGGHDYLDTQILAFVYEGWDWSVHQVYIDLKIISCATSNCSHFRWPGGETTQHTDWKSQVRVAWLLVGW